MLKTILSQGTTSGDWKRSMTTLANSWIKLKICLVWGWDWASGLKAHATGHFCPQWSYKI